MAEITSNSNVVLAKAIKEICDAYQDDGEILAFYRKLAVYKNDIKNNSSAELYEKFNCEYRCVYYESLYGDGEYTDHVVNECIDALETITQSLL